MMYLLAMGWFLAPTSLAMTPEQSVTSGELFIPEICKSRGVKEHVPLIAQRPSVTEPAHRPVARQTSTAALSNWKQNRTREDVPDKHHHQAMCRGGLLRTSGLACKSVAPQAAGDALPRSWAIH